MKDQDRNKSQSPEQGQQGQQGGQGGFSQGQSSDIPEHLRGGQVGQGGQTGSREGLGSQGGMGGVNQDEV